MPGNIFDTAPATSTAPSPNSGNIFDGGESSPKSAPVNVFDTPTKSASNTPSQSVTTAVESLFSKIGGVIKTGAQDLVANFSKPAINPAAINPSKVPADSTTGIINNTVTGLPKAALDATGIGEVQDYLNTPEGQEAASNLSASDWGKGLVAGAQGAVKGLVANPISDVVGIFAGPQTYTVPGLGQVSNIQQQVKQAVMGGENPYLSVFKAVPQSIFDGLMVAGVAEKVFSPRQSVIATGVKTNDLPASSEVPGEKDFRQTVPTTTSHPIPNEALDALQEQGVKLKGYDSNNPTFFRTSTLPNGVIKGEIVQIKPSYFDTFMSKFGGDISKAPDDISNVVYEKSQTPQQLKENLQPITESKNSTTESIQQIAENIKAGKPGVESNTPTVKISNGDISDIGAKFNQKPVEVNKKYEGMTDYDVMQTPEYKQGVVESLQKLTPDKTIDVNKIDPQKDSIGYWKEGEEDQYGRPMPIMLTKENVGKFQPGDYIYSGENYESALDGRGDRIMRVFTDGKIDVVDNQKLRNIEQETLENLDPSRAGIKVNVGAESKDVIHTKVEGRKTLPERPAEPERITAYKERLKLRGADPVLVDAIITPKGNRAYGVSVGGQISLEKTVEHLTEDHEVFHQVFQNMDKMRLFKNFNKGALLDEAKDLYGDLPEAQLEEEMAKDFQQYVNERESGKQSSFFGKVGEFFQRLFASIKRLFRNDNDINEFYRTTYEGKATEPTVINDEMPAQFNQQVKDGVLDFRIQNSVANFLEEVPVEDAFTDSGDLTLKTIQKLQGRTTVSKQYIYDLSNSGDIKQVERDLIRSVLDAYPDQKVDVAQFAQDVKDELLPLERTNVGEGRAGGKETKYESISLPDDLRGNVANYYEPIYQSPIKTSAGDVHFSGIKNYFGHTRIEDMAGNNLKGNQINTKNGAYARQESSGNTRRVIEVQSDLYQKGRLENEKIAPSQELIDMEKDHAEGKVSTADFRKAENEFYGQRDNEISKLSQYNDPTAHFRMVREEIRKAAQDGKTKLQFPTGETAMKIEGLGNDSGMWYNIREDGNTGLNLKESDLKVGKEIKSGPPGNWIITDVLGNGKFEAAPKRLIEKTRSEMPGYGEEFRYKIPIEKVIDFLNQNNRGWAESFDISGKVDTSNPIYRFYEKDLGKYLKNNYNAVPVTDDKGVTWMEVPVNPGYADLPVPAFNEKKETQTVEQLQNQRERFQQSLQAYNDNPQAHIQAYGEDKSQIYKDKIVEITKRIQEIKNPIVNTGDKLADLRTILKATEDRTGAQPIAPAIAKMQEKLKAITPDANIPKIHVSGKDIQLPENLSRRQLSLELEREQLNNSPYKDLLPYVAKSGDFKNQLPEVLGKKAADLKGTSYKNVKSPNVLKFIQSGDEIVQSLFGQNTDTEEVRAGMEDYLKRVADAKSESATLRKDISGYIKEEKDNIALDRMSQKELTDQEKIDEKQREKESLDNWKSLFQTYAQEAGLPQSVSEVEPPKARGGIASPELNFTKWKDKATPALTRDTFERNLEKVAPKSDADALKKFIVEPVRQNELDRTEFNNKLKLDTRAKIKELGIKRNSVSDELVQKWGEGLISPEELQKLAPGNYNEIKQASEYFRNQYDMLINKWNDVRKEFGYPEVPKRKDYFRHFDDINFFTKTYGFLQSQDQLPTEIAGKTEFFKPGKTFSTAEMSRTGNSTKYSAIGGFNNYIDSVTKQIYHIDSIQRGRALEKYIDKVAETATRLGEPLKLSNFVANLREYVNNGLAGKTATLDRAIENNLGRPALQAFSRISKLIGKNIIVGNISTALSHLVSLPLIGATTDKIPFIKGLMTTLTSPLKAEPFTMIDGQKSSYLIRRFPIDEISATIPKTIEQALSYVFVATDKFKSRLAVSGKYYEGISNGLSPEEAMKQADIYAGKVLGDYSLGQKPNLMNSKTLGLIAQFQLGLNDSMSVLIHDIPEGEKEEKQDAYGNTYRTTKKWAVTSKLIQFAIFSYLFNLLIKDIRGSGKGLDPIDLGLTLSGLNTEGKGQSFPARLNLAGKDVLGELPFTSTFTGNFPLSTAFSEPIKDIQAGNYAKAAEGVAAEFASPVGGGSQAKKTVEGAESIQKGQSVGAGQDIKSLIFGASTAVNPNNAISLKLATKLKTETTKLNELDAGSIARVQPVFDQAKAAGFGTAKADELVSTLSDYDYKVYTAMKAVDKAQDAINLEAKVLPIVQQAQKLGFGTAAADKLINDSFPNTPEGDAEYAAYQSVKASFTLKPPTGTVGNNNNGDATFEGHPTYYTGQSGPVASTILGENNDAGKIKGTNPNGEPIYARDAGLETSRKAEMYKADPYWKDNGYTLGDTQFDHIVPLEAGGTNTANNVMLISKVADEANQNFEDYLGQQYKAGNISRADAAKASIDYKINKTVSLTDVENGKY